MTVRLRRQGRRAIHAVGVLVATVDGRYQDERPYEMTMLAVPADTEPGPGTNHTGVHRRPQDLDAR